MSTIRSSTPIDIVVNDNTVFTANSSGIIITGSISSTSPVVSASFATTASYALNAGASINTGSFATTGSNIFNGNQTITGSLSINNLTSGSILFATTGGLISQDNSTFFWDDTNKTLKIGNSIPPSDNSAFKIQVTQVNSNSTIVATALTNTANEGPGITFARYRGTVSSPVVVDSEDRMGQFTFIGWDGAARQASSAILSFVDGAVSSGVLPSRIDFQTGTTGAGRATRLSIKNNGNILINTTTDAGYKLDVSGSGRFTNGLTVTGSLNIIFTSGSSPQNLISVASQSITRFTLSNFGVASFTLNSSAVEAGNVNISTPSGFPGLQFFTSGSLNRFDAFNSGSLFVLGYRLVNSYGTLAIFNTSHNVSIGYHASGSGFGSPPIDSGYKLLVSSSGVSGSFNANNVLLVSGSNVNLNGNLIVSGNTTIGDATTDTITMTAATMSLGSGTGILNIDSNTFVVDGANNRVGIGKANPNSALDINGNTILSGSLTFAAPISPSFNGEIVQFGSGTLTTGQLYFLSSSGTWSLANANSTGSSTGMLGLAVGSSPTTNGLLIRGFAASSSYTYGTGSVVYMATGSGIMTATSPSSSNHVVRVMGYQTTLANTIYFDPDKTWVTLA